MKCNTYLNSSTKSSTLANFKGALYSSPSSWLNIVCLKYYAVCDLLIYFSTCKLHIHGNNKCISLFTPSYFSWNYSAIFYSIGMKFLLKLL